MTMTTDTAPLVAWHGDPDLKAERLARVEAHRAADRIVQGHYWQQDPDGVWSGCSVGCTMERPGAVHADYETELGIPRLLARLNDRIFEGLPREAAMAWPGRFLAAIAPGADLSGVWPRFAVELLNDPDHGVIRVAKLGSRQHDAITAVASLYLQQIGGRQVAAEEWRSAAAAYAAYAAYAAAYAAYAAADADYAAADAYAAAAADAYAYRWMADLLIRLLTEAPVPA